MRVMAVVCWLASAAILAGGYAMLTRAVRAQSAEPVPRLSSGATTTTGFGNIGLRAMNRTWLTVPCGGRGLDCWSEPPGEVVLQELPDTTYICAERDGERACVTYGHLKAWLDGR